MAYKLARKLQADAAITPRRKLAIDLYATRALCKLASMASGERA
jgi:hypothetical protein